MVWFFVGGFYYEVLFLSLYGCVMVGCGISVFLVLCVFCWACFFFGGDLCGGICWVL